MRRSLAPHLFALILLLAFALRLWNLGTQSLWHDEGWSVFAAYTPFAPMGIRGADVNAPWAYYASVGGWLRLVGDSVWAMRYWSLILGLLTVAASAWVARRLFDERTALLTALFVAFNPMLWTFSQEIRGYVVIPLAAVLLLGLVARWVDAPSPFIGRGRGGGVLLLIAIVEFFALYAQNLSVPLVAWLNVSVGAILLWRQAWRRLAVWLVVQAILFVLYLPWLLTQRPTGTALNTPPAITPDLLWNIWHSHFVGVKPLVNADPLLMALIAIVGGVGAAGVVLALRGRRTMVLTLAISQVLLVPVFEVAIIYAAHIDFHPRYFIVSVPAALMLIAWGLGSVNVPALRRSLTWGMAALILAIMGRVGWLTFSSPLYQHDDFRSIAERYARLSEADAILIPYGWEPSLDYYRGKMNFRARMIEVPFQSTAQTITEQLMSVRAAERIEVLTWFQLPADVRGAYSCLLRTLTTPTEDSLTTSGVRTDRYHGDRALASVQPVTISAEPLRFGALDLMATGEFAPLALWGRESLCLRTYWTLHAPTPHEWRLVVRLYNDLGWLIGQTDTPLLNDKQLPTPFWKPGLGSMFSDVPLPAGAHDGPYRVTVSLYHEAAPQGAEAIDAATGRALGKTPALTADPLIRRALPSPLPSGDTTAVRPLLDGFGLHRADLPERVRQGQRVRITLEWWQTRAFAGQLSAEAIGEVVLRGDGWQANATRGQCVKPLPLTIDARVLNWCEVTVPPTAQGSAQLAVVGTARMLTLATYPLEDIGRTFSEPAFLYTAQVEPPAAFTGVGELLGASVGSKITAGQPFAMALLWRAMGTPETAYKVFVHLVSPDGRVIAQSDAEPVGGERPTIGWVAGEYLTDPHTLTFNDPAYRGTVQVAIGFYDPETNERVRLADGTDQARLPIAMVIE